MPTTQEKRPGGVLAPAVDTFMAAVRWTRNRMVIVYRREHAGRQYVRLRTFNRHQAKGRWYPAPRFYMVPIDCADELASAISAAAHGRPYGLQPEWWAEFKEQYEAFPRREKGDAGVARAVAVDCPAIRFIRSNLYPIGCAVPNTRSILQ